MKKTIAIVLALIMVLALAGCGSGGTSTAASGGDDRGSFVFGDYVGNVDPASGAYAWVLGQKLPAIAVGDKDIPHLQTRTLIDHVPDPALGGNGQLTGTPPRKVFQTPLVILRTDVKTGVHDRFSRLLSR